MVRISAVDRDEVVRTSYSRRHPVRRIRHDPFRHSDRAESRHQTAARARVVVVHVVGHRSIGARTRGRDYGAGVHFSANGDRVRRQLHGDRLDARTDRNRVRITAASRRFIVRVTAVSGDEVVGTRGTCGPPRR